MFLGSAFFCSDHKHTRNGKQGTYSGYKHGRNNSIGLDFQTLSHKGSGAQEGCCENRSCKRFKKVSPHTGYIAHVISYIIGNGRGISRIIFRNSCLYLAYKICTHISSLGVDTSSNACKQRLGGSPHPESEHHCGNGHQFVPVGSLRDKVVQDDKPKRYINQHQSYHDQSHHRTAAKGKAQSTVERSPASICHTR